MLKVLITCMIIVGLIAGGTVSAFASTQAESSGKVELSFSATELEESIDELPRIEGFELMPIPLPDKSVNINGGFRGVWGKDNTLAAAERPGIVFGVYGTAERPDGTRYGFFTGIWKDNDGRTGGYLEGRYGNGQFRGMWRCVQTGMGGPLKGIYTPTINVANEAVHHFVGRWATEDGQQIGYLKGTWAPIVSTKVEGRFSGFWAHRPEATAADTAPDGKLAGTYGVIELMDGSSIRCFIGKWLSDEGAQERIGGLIRDGSFYGLGTCGDGNIYGYLKGIWANHQFKGVWGHFGHEPEGRIWGRYGPFVTPQPVQEQPLSVQSTTATPMKPVENSK